MSAPESFIKKREVAAKRAATLKIVAANKAVKAIAMRKEIFARAKKYDHEYKSAEKTLVFKKRLAKATAQYFVPAETKVYLVIRILGTYGVNPKVKKILQLFRLRQINNATFVRANKATLNMLIKVAPYVTWGSPSKKTVSDLLYKRGYVKYRGQRTRITSNDLVQQVLGGSDIICVEDMIHELVNCGSKFKMVNSYLWPFKLNSPLGGWVAKKTGFNEGGDAGDRKENINSLIARMC